MTATTKPHEVTATQWFRHGDHPSVQRSLTLPETKGWIENLEAGIDRGFSVNPGDWIIEDRGRVYPVSQERFEREFSGPQSTGTETPPVSHPRNPENRSATDLTGAPTA